MLAQKGECLRLRSTPDRTAEQRGTDVRLNFPYSMVRAALGRTLFAGGRGLRKEAENKSQTKPRIRQR